MGGERTTAPEREPRGAIGSFLEQRFRLTENGTSVRTEFLAGVTTFMTMAYIIFVNPSILQNAGMDFDALVYATIAAVVVATLTMAFLANYPFALAPGMGLNAYFTFTVVIGMGIEWQTALGAVFISGLLFLLLTVTGIREMIINAVPSSLKWAIAGGIGLFIALIGAENAGIVVEDPATLVTLGDLTAAGPLLALLGTLLIGILMARRVHGAILYGILIATALAIPFGVTDAPEAVVEAPRFGAWAPIFAELDLRGALEIGLLQIVLIFLFVDLFDTTGTLIGVSTQGGFLDEQGRLPRANRALVTDAGGTMVGSLFGTSTVTTYIESAAGVAAGGKTGLTGVFVSAGFLLSLIFLPIIRIVPPEATAPALIIVGVLMLGSIVRISWDDISEAVPAFVTMVAMPFTFSIANGIALGFISYPIIKAISGRAREVHWLMYVLAALFVLRYALLD
jgi:adenine/guanine/hypoxanthine permease